jgi:hypothetical protein
MSETCVDERAHKRSAADGNNPLSQEGILQLVIDLVGPGEHAFVATVSKGFRAYYMNVQVDEGVYPNSSGGETTIAIQPQMTTCSAIFESLSRLRWAIDLGFVLDPKSWWCQYYAGNCADIETLTELHEQHHMLYTEDVCRGAAELGTFSKLQWLLDEQQCPQPDNLDCAAVHAPTLDVLKWLKQRECVFTADTCAAAAKSVHAASVLQYLHSEGVRFDVRTITTAITYQEVPLLQWLCEHGCNLSEVDPLSERPLQDLQVLSWLHSKGCPCDYGCLCCNAAFNGYITTLKWAKDNGVIDWSAAALSEYLNVAAAFEELETAKVRENCLNCTTIA